MIKVTYTELDGPSGPTLRLEAAGHAGYAPAGQDIAFRYAAGGNVYPDRSGNAAHINAGMIVKPGVFRRNKSLL